MQETSLIPQDNGDFFHGLCLGEGREEEEEEEVQLTSLSDQLP